MKPILFNTEMVQANLNGRKTATRRVVKKFSGTKGVRIYKTACGEFYVDVNGLPTDFQLSPPYLPGDILYVRETWAVCELAKNGFIYRACFNQQNGDAEKSDAIFKWRPSIHMPKEAARIFLRVTDVRVERLQEITVTDLQKEGVLTDGFITQYAEMTECDRWFNKWKELWNSTIKPTEQATYGWEANPWVWVIEYEKITKEDAYGY